MQTSPAFVRSASLLAIGLHAAAMVGAGLLPAVITVSDVWDDTAAGMLAICQASLLGVWLALGRTRVWLKTLALIAEAGRIPPDFHGFMAGGVISPLPLVLLAGLTLRGRWASIERGIDETSLARVPRPQVSLRQTLIGLLVLSVAMAALRRVAGKGNEASDGGLFFVVAILGLKTSIITAAALWASLRPGSVGPRLVMGFLFSLGVGMLAGYAAAGLEQWPRWGVFIAFAAVQALLQNATLLAFRRAGYRLIFPGDLPPRAAYFAANAVAD